MSFIKKLFTHPSRGWWNLPKTPSEELDPPHEGMFGEAKPRVSRWWTKITSGDKHAGPVYYWWIGIILAVITGLEVWLFDVDMIRGVFVAVMLILSAMKFLLVIYFFMHLRFDHRGYARVFLSCMTLGLAVFISLLLLNDFYGAGA